VRFVFCWLIFSHFGFLDRFFYVYVSPANMMEGNSSDWTKQEIEKIVIWLEEEDLQRGSSLHGMSLTID